jgi:aminopeptidase N
MLLLHVKFGIYTRNDGFLFRLQELIIPGLNTQIVGRDYVSGAMENTTATLHQESAQQDARELVDGNSWESTIAHELFHQWFEILLPRKAGAILP